MRKYVEGGLAVVAALGLLALVIALAGPQQTANVLRRLEPWQAVVLVATAFGVSAFTAVAWRAVLGRYGHAVSVWLLFRLTLLAFAAGWAVPSGFAAGVPAAAWFLRRRGVPFSLGLASFTIGRFLEITAYALVLPLVLLTHLGAETVVRLTAIGTLAGLVLVYLDLTLRWRLARRLLASLRRRVPRRGRRAVDATARFCGDVADFFQPPLGPVLVASLASAAAIGVAFVRAYLASEFLDLGLPAPQVAVMFGITVFLMAVPFVPGAVGAFEGGIAGAFELLGRPRADGLAYALTVHATELVVVVAGLVVLAQLGVGLLRPAGPIEPARRRRPRRATG